MDHTHFPFDAERFGRDALCGACKGTGKRGRGRCSKCEGNRCRWLDHPRVRFNHAYHDARSNVTSGHVRAIVADGAHTLGAVSVAFCWWYAAGYALGLRDAARVTDSSEPAWLEWTGGLTADLQDRAKLMAVGAAAA